VKRNRKELGTEDNGYGGLWTGEGGYSIKNHANKAKLKGNEEFRILGSRMIVHINHWWLLLAICLNYIKLLTGYRNIFTVMSTAISQVLLMQHNLHLHQL
jgi:hypothetical protein